MLFFTFRRELLDVLCYIHSELSQIRKALADPQAVELAKKIRELDLDADAIRKLLKETDHGSQSSTPH